MKMHPHPVAEEDEGTFADWRIAAKSIPAFWLVYALTVVARALLGTDPWTSLLNKLPTIAVGMLLTAGIYAAMRLFAFKRSLTALAVTAAVGSLIAASAQGILLVALDGHFKPSKEEFRFQTTEGFTIIEKGDTLKVERAAQDPLVLTMPHMNAMDSSKQIRWAADAAVTWFFFFAAWSAFYLASVAQANALNVQRRLADAESAAQSAQVRALRYQVNPHFLFNTLNSLSSLVMTGRPERAEAMLLALSTFFRTSLSLDPSADVSLAEEIDLQRLYLDIEKARFPDRLQVEIDVPADLQAARLPALLLQPIVENAIKYGVSKSRKAVLIRIEARHLGDGRMVVEISNRLKHGGADQLPAATHEGTGLGLSNVCQRLEARFRTRASCRYGPMTTGGFKVSLTMPIETNV